MVELMAEVSGIATALGVLLLALQVWLARRVERTAFEDTLAREYRDIIAMMPVEVMLERPGAGVQSGAEADLGLMYRYFDLCNEQVFMWQRRRISRSTWMDWREGIKANLNRPAFLRAWAEIAGKIDEKEFTGLRDLIPVGVQRPPAK